MRSLFGKMMAAYVALSLVVFVTLFVASSYLLEDYFYRAKHQELMTGASKLLRVLPLSGSMATTQTLLDGFHQFTGHDVWITDPDGVIVMTAGTSDGALGERISDDELRRLQAGEGVTRRGTGPLFPAPMFSIGLPIPEGDGVQGALFVHAPLVGVKDTIDGVRRLVLYAALASIGVAALLFWILSRWIAAPLAQFTEAAGRMASGQWNVQVPSRGHDEVGRLGQAFNHLARELHSTIDRLKQESSKLAAVVQSMQDGVVFVNPQGIVEMANEPFLEMAGARGAVVGRAAEEAFPALPELAGWFRRALQGNERVFGEMEAGKRAYDVKIAPVMGGDFIWGAVGVLRDMSEHRALEAMRRDFIANISHELRTPLTSIRGFLEAAVDGIAQSPEEVDEYLRIAMEETERMRRLVLTLMDLSSIESGRVTLYLEPIHLRRAVMTVLDKLTPQIRSKGLVIETDLPPDLPSVSADSDKLEQILMNLIHNAVRHTPAGGVIRIGAAVRDGSGRWVEVVVTDSGPGIPPPELDRIWERFYKVDKARPSTDGASGAGGAGLGLAIVKELVEAHGGQVGVSLVGAGVEAGAGAHGGTGGSRNGSVGSREPEIGGCAFSFTLPVASER